MFVLGRHYKVVISQDGGKLDTSSPLECIDISMPMVKFKSAAAAGRESRESIINVASLAFVRADLLPIPSSAAPEKPSFKVEKL